MRARLIQVEDDIGVATRALESKGLVVGRDASADWTLLGTNLSRHHISVEPLDDGGHCLRDLSSTNGTRVNGEILREPVRLRAGDVISLGDEVTLVYELD